VQIAQIDKLCDNMILYLWSFIPRLLHCHVFYVKHWILLRVARCC